MEHSKNKRLYKNTYASLTGRIENGGYARTSVTGAYPGMFVRDSSIQVMAHIINGDFAETLNIMNYIFDYHKKYGFDFALHVIDNGRPLISDRRQADTSYFLAHAWCLYSGSAPDSAEKKAFLEKTAPQVKAFTDYWFKNGFYDEEQCLLRNPCFEHTRDGSYFNCFDQLTNVYASQSFFELAHDIKPYDHEYATVCLKRADEIAGGIHRNLTATVDGKTVYAEMRSFSKERGCDSLVSEDRHFYVGFCCFNLSAMGAGWYAADSETLENTYNAALKYGGRIYFDKYRMLDACSTYICDGKSDIFGGHILGKGLAWELMYCRDTGKTERLDEIVRFIEEHSGEMYRETWTPDGGGSDTANQEHASWMIYAMKYVFGDEIKD